MMGKTPQLSMGLPVYNGERYIRQSLYSVLAQDMEDFEIIVSDNASRDRSADIAEEIARQDSRVRVIRQPSNRGAAANFNFVFQQARGPFFKWVCADDVLAPGFLSRGLAELEANPETVLCYGSVTLIDGEDKTLGEYQQGLDLRSANVVQRFRVACQHGGLLNVLQGIVRSDVLRRTRLLGTFPSSDEALVVELSLYGTFHEVSDPMLFRRMHDEAASAVDTVRARQEHLDPTSAGRLHLQVLRRSIEHLRAVARAPLSIGLRARMVGVVLRLLAANWDVVRGELAELTRSGTGRILRR